MELPAWEPRRVVAMGAVLPEGVTPAGTRGRILKAGLELFAESGFAGASIRQIAGIVGINSATLYAHYPSKGHVFAALVRIGHEEMLSRLTEAAAATRDDSAGRQLAALVRAHVLLHTDYPLLAVVTNNELHALAPELARTSLELRERCRRMLADVLELGMSSGEFSLDDPMLAVTAIGGLGVQVAQWFGPTLGRTREQVADQYVQFALRMAGTRG